MSDEDLEYVRRMQQQIDLMNGSSLPSAQSTLASFFQSLDPEEARTLQANLESMPEDQRSEIMA